MGGGWWDASLPRMRVKDKVGKTQRVVHGEGSDAFCFGNDQEGVYELGQWSTTASRVIKDSCSSWLESQRSMGNIAESLTLILEVSGNNFGSRHLPFVLFWRVGAKVATNGLLLLSTLRAWWISTPGALFAPTASLTGYCFSKCDCRVVMTALASRIGEGRR